MVSRTRVEKRMVVWLIFSLYPPYTGGAATYSELLSHALSISDAIKHVVLLTEYHPRRIFLRSKRLTVLGILPRRDSLAQKNLALHAITFMVTQFIILFLLVWIAIRRGAHVAHLHNRYIYRWTGFIVGLLKISAVADVRDRFANLIALRTWPAVISVSKAIVNQVAEKVPVDRISYIPMPMDLDELKRSHSSLKPRSQPYFLYVGDINERKGARELIAAYHEYIARHGSQSPELVLVGLNQMKDVACQDSGKSGAVRLLGSLARESVYALIAGADRVVLPSKGEGLPRVCVEAIALGVPVICPPKVEEFERHCAQSVLSEITVPAILEMLERPRESLRVNSYPIEIHDWKSSASATVAVYRKVLR